jgi:uncharacterized protein (DUF488 family)
MGAGNRSPGRRRRTVEELLDLNALAARVTPQTALRAGAVPHWLRDAGIEYIHLPELGRRRGRQDVPPTVNAGWRQPNFKNYADYTPGPGYQRGIERLTQLSEAAHLAIMCGEPMPWRCPRPLIANTLTWRWSTCLWAVRVPPLTRRT